MKKSLLFVSTLLLATTFATQSFALDHYQGREGLYLHLGASVGGGAFSHKDAQGNYHTDKRQVDGGVSLGAGFGINSMFVVGGEVLWTGTSNSKQTFDIAVAQQSHKYFLHNVNVMGGLDVFIFGGLVVGVSGGLAYYNQQFSTTTTTVVGNNIIKSSEDAVGFGIKGSVGYEAFVNGDLAIGGRFYYLHNFFDQKNYSTLGAAISLRWY